MSVQGINITGFVMATELFPPKERTIAAVSHEFFWALGGAILPGWAYLLRQWRHLQLVVSLPTIAAFVLIWSVSAYSVIDIDLLVRGAMLLSLVAHVFWPILDENVR